ncbi:Glycosyl transferase family 2 [Lachnospiraceae bacterium NE2001]|nr:Glycosyl transferase family 2 [Lachnospiraceae bacterium NE2001]
MKLITVFTPTYNRKKTLRKCYESLIAQTSNNFIWQIIDDGSTDNTEELVTSFINEGVIEISYIKKPNGGKVSAINMSLDVTETELWVCLDSDDYFFPKAIETYERLYDEIKDKPEICGLFSVRSNPDRSPMMGCDVPTEIVFETQFNLRYKYKVEPEYVQVYKTAIVNQYKYPLFEGEKYVPLSYTQDQIDQKYKFLIFHEPTMVCEYQADGITKNQKRLVKKNPKGYTEFKRQQIEIAPNFAFKLKACITYDTGCILSGNKIGVLRSPNVFLTILCFPLGWLDCKLRYSNFKK